MQYEHEHREKVTRGREAALMPPHDPSLRRLMQQHLSCEVDGTANGFMKGGFYEVERLRHMQDEDVKGGCRLRPRHG